MPDERAPHAATWMAFGADVDLWGAKLLPVIRENLANVAKAIVDHETVNMLVREEDYEIASRLCGPLVSLVVQPIDDVWLRDTGPVFVTNPAGQLGAVGFNFDGWGDKPQRHARKQHLYARDAKVAEHMAGAAQATFLKAGLVLEGGGLEVDGEGTAIITESCVLNPNRNPGLTKDRCEVELSQLLGLDKVIWLPGVRDEDITDGHTDFYARFTGPGVVVAGLEMDPSCYDYEVTRQHLKILQASTDAKGRRLKIVELPGPSTVRPAYSDDDDFAAGYINFYVCNGAVIAPEFGDVTADRNAFGTLRELYPGREIIQLNIDAIAAGGGGIHCVTQQQPRV